VGTVQRETRVESFQTDPSRYRHWKLALKGDVAVLALDVVEENGLRPDDYLLKQNSYDLGVDIELNDAIDRLRFEHPEVRCVVFTSAQPRVFCAGANIRMLASSTHAFKVNFCRYTNETRLGLEDASAMSGLKSLVAANGTAAGGGYELALAADEIWLVDDGAAAVSLPEVPLLGVLPGTGGLTRLVDKRRVRRDVADLFCTKAEGVRARDALKMGLIDGALSRSQWEAGIDRRAAALAAGSPARAAQGIAWTPVGGEVSADGRTRTWSTVRLEVSDADRVATLTISGPTGTAPSNAAALRAEGAATWSLRAFRELEDALLHLRFHHESIGVIVVRTVGDGAAVLAHDDALRALGTDWLATEIRAYQARVLRRVDHTARSVFALIDRGSCFAGSLLELAWAADRAYMHDTDGVSVRVGTSSADAWPMGTGATRLATRFLGSPDSVGRALATAGTALGAAEALDIGLVTLAPDDIDWDDEVRIAVEERVSLSPDALTGMEQNLRFAGREGCDAKIFGRLSAWQNWIFQRPNAVGDEGALTLYGHPTRPRFDWRRT
jgi:benzoyl-CoA-dihydrodiol lyase